MRKKILIIGQTPPPYHGQAIMIENTIKHTYKSLEIFHVRMNFSEGVDELGRFKAKKILVLVNIIFKIFYIRIRFGVKNLYYPPSGPDTGPIIRDILVLGMTRWIFKTTIYHFRAGGISEKVERYPHLVKIFVKSVFNKPNLTIRLSNKNPDDGGYFNTIKDVIIPNGLKDFGLNRINAIKLSSPSPPVIFFVGVIKETKGVLDLLKSCCILKINKIDFKLNILGQMSSNLFEKRLHDFIDDNELSKHVNFLGVKTGEDKWREFSNADIFCFPSYYECETFGNVLVEAMQFQLPIVATKWRGIPDIVVDNESGFLVDINSPEMLAVKLEQLINNEMLRKQLGEFGRNIFLKNFQEKTYFKNFEKNVYDIIK